MCENRVSSMAVESLTSAYGLVLTFCSSMSGIVGLPSEAFDLEVANFEDKYDLRDLLKKGRFGDEYLGVVRHSAELVSVKLYNRLALSKLQERFIRSEGMYAKSLNHNNIVRYYDFYEEPSAFYVVSERISGGTIIEKLQQRKSLNEKVIRDIFEALLGALKYCHDKDIMHRNINPESLLFSVAQSRIEDVKLGNFDFATNVASGNHLECVGEPEFVAPEVHKMRPQGKPVDLWSVGVLMYVLLSGNLPFSPKNSYILRNLIGSAKFDFDQQSWSHSSDECRKLIKKLLCVNPNARPSVDQVLCEPWFEVINQDLQNVDITSKIVAIKRYGIRARFRRAFRNVIRRLRAERQRLHLHFRPLLASCPVTIRPNPRNLYGISDSIREKALSSLSDVGADIDDLTFAEKYSLFEDQELGRGAFAVVCRGALIRNGNKVAIKLVDRTQLSSETEAIMKSEAEILKGLNHRNVIRCFDFYQEPERFVIVMEVVEGGDLLTRLARKTVYSEKDARDLVEILLSAVNHCHQHDVVHRDLKLENLLLVSDRDDNMIKLADFGLAASVSDGNTLSGFCGTPGYVAPEILELKQYGKSCDIWSAGIIVFALLGGYLPFDADSLVKYRHACTERVYFEPDFWSEVSVEAKELIQKLLQVDVNQRYTAAQALRHPWLKKSGSVLARRPLSKTLSQIKVFNLHRKFKGIAHSLIAHAKFMRRLNFGRAQSMRALTSEEESRANSVPEVVEPSHPTLQLPVDAGNESHEGHAVRYDSNYGDLGVKVEPNDLTPTPSPTAETAHHHHRKKSVSFLSDDPEMSAQRVVAALLQGGDSSQDSFHIAQIDSPASTVPAPAVNTTTTFIPLPPRPATASIQGHTVNPAMSEGSTSSEARSDASSSPAHSESPVVLETVVTVSRDPHHVFKNMYAIQTHLGKGGFGHVFKAIRRDRPEEVVAVKVLERNSMTPSEEQRVREESGIMQSIKHPNIIEFYDFFEEQKVFVIIMEYLDGGELFHRIAKKLYYNEETARNLVRALLQAVKHLHDHDIVHRDIKPENIIMANQVDDDKIKLIDFGLAARVTGLTLQGYAGTAGYVAPEIVELRAHGKPVDMWAVGVIAFILLGGYMPFDMKDKIKGRHCVRNGIFDFPDDYWSDVSGDAKNFISKLLVVDASKRLTIDQALLHPWMKRSDLRHRLLKESSSQLQKFNVRRRFYIISSAIIAKSKFERKKKLANCLSANSLHEALNLTFADLYEVQSKLGAGGFATVYKATQKKTSEIVAVKVFNRKSMSQADQDILHQEKAILLRLSHPHIIKCLDIFEEPSSFFIVMELVTGGELFDRLAHKKSYSEEEARNVIVILLSAIRHCHDNDIVHRDLKPENLLLEDEFDDSKIKVIDFGLAAHAKGNTLEGYCGTLGYIAPEILELRPHGKPVDMWSIGIIAYVLLSGYLPFDANSRVQYKKRVLRGMLEFDGEYWGGVTPEAIDMIKKLLVLDENRRLTATQALRHPWIKAAGISLRSHDLLHSKLQLAKFNAHRKFRSIARLIIAKAKFEKIMLSARSIGLSTHRPEATIEEVEEIPFRDQYEIHNELGRGGFGTVYKAVSTGVGKTKAGLNLAVKVINRTKLNSKAETQVRNEAKILMSLNHQHIIKCYDIYEEPSTFFIVMEIMEGGELFDRIVKKVYYSEKEARDVVRMLLSAIKHCHDHDVVHRDLKPENLMLASRHDDEHVKLIDFGLSGKASGLTLEGYVGTPGYTAPELFEHKPHGKPVDMWAVGVIAYVLLAGYLPFKAVPRAKYQQMARRGKLDFHAEYWSDVSAEAKDLITNLMRVKVEKRYTAEQALAHPWLRASPVLLRKNTLNKSINSMRKFNAARKFRVICKLIIAQSKFMLRMNEAKTSAALVQELVEVRQSFPEKYELMEEIGKGGFATVYRATQKKNAAASRFGMFVAVKMIDRGAMSPESENAIRTECSILQSLSHPHIVKCLDVFEEASTFFIVMEMVQGGELFSRVSLKTVYTEKEARDLVVTLLSAVKHCHDHNVVHRDLKPENIMLVSAHSSHDIKIIDFGLAAVSEGNTLTGFVGSPGYIAAEIMEGLAHGKPVDMFSVGVIAYVLLCGYLPFEAPSKAIYKKNVLRGRVEFDPMHWNNVSGSAKDLIKKLLSISMDKRLTAVQALQHDWLAEADAELNRHDLRSGLVQLKRFNARRKFRSVVNLLIAKAKFEKIVADAKLARFSLQHTVTPPVDTAEAAAALTMPPAVPPIPPN